MLSGAHVAPSTRPPPHMWPILSMAPKFTKAPDQSSFCIIFRVASATQLSPLSCPG